MIGIEDDGSVRGLADPDGDQLKIKDRLKQNIQPSCMGLFDVLLEESEGKGWIKLIVAGGSEKPYYLQYLYNAEGLLTKLHHSSGGIVQVTDAGLFGMDGSQVAFTTDAAGRIGAVTESNGNRILYTYDTHGRLDQVNDLANARSTWFSYQDQGLLEMSVQDGQVGNLYRYDAAGLLVETLTINTGLGSLRDALAATPSGTLAAGQTHRIAFVLGERELLSTFGGALFLGAKITGAPGIDPVISTLRGVGTDAARAPPGESSGLFQLRSPGLYLLELNGVGDWSLDLFLPGDFNADGHTARFLPDPAHVGVYSFRFLASDGLARSNEAVITLDLSTAGMEVLPDGQVILTLKGTSHGTDASLLRAYFSASASNLSTTLAPGIFQERLTAGEVQLGTVLSADEVQVQLLVPKGMPLGSLTVRVDARQDLYVFETMVGADLKPETRWISSMVTGVILPAPYYTWIANTGSDTVTVLDPRSQGAVAQITVGSRPADVAVSEDGRYVFVTNSGEGTLSVIDAISLVEIDMDPTREGIQRITFNGGRAAPWFLALAPAYTSGDVVVGFVTDHDSGRLFRFAFNPKDLRANILFAPEAYNLRNLAGLEGTTGLGGVTVTRGNQGKPDYVVVTSLGRQGPPPKRHRPP